MSFPSCDSSTSQAKLLSDCLFKQSSPFQNESSLPVNSHKLSVQNGRLITDAIVGSCSALLLNDTAARVRVLHVMAQQTHMSMTAVPVQQQIMQSEQEPIYCSVRVKNQACPTRSIALDRCNLGGRHIGNFITPKLSHSISGRLRIRLTSTVMQLTDASRYYSST